jgi:hypothetical protein
LLAATVGVVLRSLEDKSKLLGRIAAGIFGTAWSLACYLVVPVLAAEGLGPSEALARSAELFTRTWGEQLSGGFSFGLIFTLLALPGVLFIYFATGMGQHAMLIGFGLAVAYWLLLSVVSSAAKGVFIAALYHYARTREATGGFSLDDLAGAWRPKSPYMVG